MRITQENALQTFNQWQVTILRDLPRAFPTLGDLRETLEVALKDEEIGTQFFELLDFIGTDGTYAHKPADQGKAKAAQKSKTDTAEKTERKTEKGKVKKEKRTAKKEDEQPKAKRQKPKAEEAIEVTQASTTHNILTRYFALDGLTINAATRKKALAILSAVQKAIFTRRVRQNTPEGNLFLKAQDNLILIAKPENDGKVIEIANKTQLKPYKRKEKTMDKSIKSAMQAVLAIASKPRADYTDEDWALLDDTVRYKLDKTLPACRAMSEAISDFMGDQDIQYLVYPMALSGLNTLSGF